MEADLQRFYDTPLSGLFNGGLSWRRLGVLVANLPSESALARKLYPQAAWSTESYLLAAVVDGIQAGNWQRAGRKNSPRPKPIPRPGDRTHIKGTSMRGDEFDRVYAQALDTVRDREEAGETVWQEKGVN